MNSFTLNLEEFRLNFRGEPEILLYAITQFCSMGADVRHEKICSHAGIAFSDELRSVLVAHLKDSVAHLKDSAKGKHGAHTYNLSGFWMTVSAIKARCAGYKSRFPD